MNTLTDRSAALQSILDAARMSKNKAWNEYKKYRSAPVPNYHMINVVRGKYDEANEFYEGIALAILAAGYTITGDIGTDTCTVTL